MLTAQFCRRKQPLAELDIVFKLDWVRQVIFLSDTLSPPLEGAIDGLSLARWDIPLLKKQWELIKAAYCLFTVNNSSSRWQLIRKPTLWVSVKSGMDTRQMRQKSIIIIISGYDKPQLSLCHSAKEVRLAKGSATALLFPGTTWRTTLKAFLKSSSEKVAATEQKDLSWKCRASSITREQTLCTAEDRSHGMFVSHFPSPPRYSKPG